MAAAEGGDPEAQYELANRYSLGSDVPKDHAKSVHWSRRAAEQGHTGAQLLLGIKYELGGLGVPQDYGASVQWYRKAAEQGHAPGQFALAEMYQEGLGVLQDYREAVRWYRRAAEQGHTNAQFSLGTMYYEGRGVPQDDATAARWYRRAAATEPQFHIVGGKRYVAMIAGQAEAQNNLGLLYAEGRGVPQDDAAAVHWYRRAAELRNATAQHNLGLMYSKGRGVLKDQVVAHMWFNIAGANGHEPARSARDAVEVDLTRVEINRATELARACMASNYQACDP